MKGLLGRLRRRRRETQEQHTRETFDRWARARKDEEMERGHGPIARRVFDSLPLAETAHYLDIGCGNGYSVRWAAERAPRGRAVGIDLSPEMIRIARGRSADAPNAEFHEAAFPRYELSPASFGAIFSMETLYDLPDPGAALIEIRRLLKPGGWFASAIDAYRGHPMSRRWIEYVGARVKLWDDAQWRSAFSSAGFTEVGQERMILPPPRPWRSGTRESVAS